MLRCIRGATSHAVGRPSDLSAYQFSQLLAAALEIQTLLGDQLFAMQAHWFWFSLNEHPGP